MCCQLPGASGLGASILPGCLCLSLSATAGAAPQLAHRTPGDGAAAAADHPSSSSVAAAAAAFVGVEGGQLLRCHLADPQDAALRDFSRSLAGGAAPEMRSPVREAGYERHAGAVTGAVVSRFQVRGRAGTWAGGRAAWNAAAGACARAASRDAC